MAGLSNSLGKVYTERQDMGSPPNPEDHPDEIFIICLHDGGTSAENAEAVCSWVVKTETEFRTVADVLDNLIATDMDLEEAIWTLVRVPKEKEISLKAVADDVSSYLEKY